MARLGTAGLDGVAELGIGKGGDAVQGITAFFVV